MKSYLILVSPHLCAPNALLVSSPTVSSNTPDIASNISRVEPINVIGKVEEFQLVFDKLLTSVNG